MWFPRVLIHCVLRTAQTLGIRIRQFCQSVQRLAPGTRASIFLVLGRLMPGLLIHDRCPACLVRCAGSTRTSRSTNGGASSSRSALARGPGWSRPSPRRRAAPRRVAAATEGHEDNVCLIELLARADVRVG